MAQFESTGLACTELRASPNTPQKPGMAVNTCNPRTPKVEAGGSEMLGSSFLYIGSCSDQAGLHEIVSQFSGGERRDILGEGCGCKGVSLGALPP